MEKPLRYTICSDTRFVAALGKARNKFYYIQEDSKMEEQRINPMEPPYPEEVESDFKAIMPPGVPPLNIFRTVARNPRVLHRMIIGGLLDRGSISIQEREIMILRTCAMCGAEYEWGVHVAGFSHKAELTQPQIRDTQNQTPDTSLWNEKQQILIELSDQLHYTQTLTDQFWSRLSEHFRADQIIELVMLAGLYHAVSYIVNAAKIEKETFAPTFS
jgi:alkylhydroperoxidase family enzyme